MKDQLCDLLESYKRQEPGSEGSLIIWLRRFAFVLTQRCVRDQHLAEDIVQEILFNFHKRQVINRLLDLHEKREFPVRYLSLIIRNGMIDYLRRDQSRKHYEQFTSYKLLVLVDSHADESMATDRREQIEVLQNRLLELTESDRKLIRMHYGFEGQNLGYAEIAALLGITEEAAKKRGQRLLRTLKHHILSARNSGNRSN